MDYSRWVTASNDIIEIKNMTTSHIDNAITMLRRGSDKSANQINPEWLLKHRDNYIEAFDIELAIREELKCERENMICRTNYQKRRY